ncbi:MAG: alpha/beta hydrolase [Gammaproteobacteria bacterium]|nr:alpha/beta hydrolase [Gammaproteobacteria bacterium]
MSQIQRANLAGLECVVAEPPNLHGDTETLVCLHGIGGDDASFLPQMHSLSDLYRVVSWNMPGYRQSRPLKQYSFDTLCTRLIELLNALDVQKAHLMGQSIGGMLAQELYHTQPQRVKSLVLIATTSAFGGSDDSFEEAFLEARLKPLDQGVSMSELAQTAIPAIVGSRCTPAAVQAAIESMQELSVQTYREILRCLVTFNRRTELPLIRCPVCLIAGSEDSNSPARTMKKMADQLPHSEFHVIEGAGHLVNLECAGKTNSLVKKFLKTVFSS